MVEVTLSQALQYQGVIESTLSAGDGHTFNRCCTLTNMTLMGIPTNRDVTAAFHLFTGSQWLIAADGGRNTNAIVYCGFEFRLALERVNFELLLHIRRERGESITDADIKAMNKPINIRNRIYQLVGNQQHIDKQVEFINILIEIVGQPFIITSVNLGRLARYWSECSDLCHMQPSKKHTWEDDEFCKENYNILVDTKLFLENALSGLTWFSVHGHIYELKKLFINGAIDKTEVINRLKENGIYAIMTLPDGTEQVLPGLEPDSGNG